MLLKWGVNRTENISGRKSIVFFVGQHSELLKNIFWKAKIQKMDKRRKKRFEFRDGGKWKVDVQIKGTPRLPHHLQNSENRRGATEKATKLPTAANGELCGGGSGEAPFEL
jgi:hypothetical protein